MEAGEILKLSSYDEMSRPQYAYKIKLTMFEMDYTEVQALWRELKLN